jgi:hypothetical protein
MTSAPNLYRNLGLAGGSLWLIAVGTVFAGWSLITIQSTLAMMLTVFLATAAAALIMFGVLLLRSVRRLPHECATDGGAARRKMALRFGLIVAAEGLGCTLVAMTCLRAHKWELIVQLNLVIVGLHFLPLARLFKVPRYNVTGILFCIFPIATLLAVSPSAHIGHALSWIALPAIGCGLVALITGAAGLDEVRQFLNRSTGLSTWNSAARSA